MADNPISTLIPTLTWSAEEVKAFAGSFEDLRRSMDVAKVSKETAASVRAFTLELQRAKAQHEALFGDLKAQIEYRKELERQLKVLKDWRDNWKLSTSALKAVTREIKAIEAELGKAERRASRLEGRFRAIGTRAKREVHDFTGRLKASVTGALGAGGIGALLGVLLLSSLDEASMRRITGARLLAGTGGFLGGQGLGAARGVGRRVRTVGGGGWQMLREGRVQALTGITGRGFGAEAVLGPLFDITQTVERTLGIGSSAAADLADALTEQLGVAVKDLKQSFGGIFEVWRRNREFMQQNAIGVSEWTTQIIKITEQYKTHGTTVENVTSFYEGLYKAAEQLRREQGLRISAGGLGAIAGGLLGTAAQLSPYTGAAFLQRLRGGAFTERLQEFAGMPVPGKATVAAQFWYQQFRSMENIPLPIRQIELARRVGVGPEQAQALWGLLEQGALKTITRLLGEQKPTAERTFDQLKSIAQTISGFKTPMDYLKKIIEKVVDYLASLVELAAEAVSRMRESWLLGGDLNQFQEPQRFAKRRSLYTRQGDEAYQFWELGRYPRPGSFFSPHGPRAHRVAAYPKGLPGGGFARVAEQTSQLLYADLAEELQVLAQQPKVRARLHSFFTPQSAGGEAITNPELVGLLSAFGAQLTPQAVAQMQTNPGMQAAYRVAMARLLTIIKDVTYEQALAMLFKGTNYEGAVTPAKAPGAR